jgi:lauroyl/myristoyl acyltransferase
VSRLGDRVALIGYRAGWRVVRRLPAGVAYAGFDLLAQLTYRRGGRGVDRLRANYALARPDQGPLELEDLVRAGLRSYLRYWCDAFRLPELGLADLDASVRGVNHEPLKALLDAGRPVIVFLGHMGNWDLGGAWSSTHLAPVHTVAERLQPEELFAEFLAFRRALGMTIVPLTGGDDVFRTLVRFCREGRLVALLADRDMTEGGVEVDFCGHRARMAVGPAALAVSTGAALFTCTLYYERSGSASGASTGGSASGASGPDGTRRRCPRRGSRSSPGTGSGFTTVVTFSDQVPVPTAGTTRAKVAVMTQACADTFGQAVTAHTQDWHMMQQVFVSADAARAKLRP